MRFFEKLALLLGATLVLVSSVSISAAALLPDSAKICGFAVGCQAYTFNRFSVYEAIEKTAQTGSKTIEFYPGQKLSPGEPNLKWDHNASDEVIQNVKDQLAKHKILAAIMAWSALRMRPNGGKFLSSPRNSDFTASPPKPCRTSMLSRSWSKSSILPSAFMNTRSPMHRIHPWLGRLRAIGCSPSPIYTGRLLKN